MNQRYLTRARKSVIYGSYKSKNPLLIVLMGLPGTGKSYLANYLNKRYSFSILSGENVTHSIFGSDKHSTSQYKEAYEILRFLAAEMTTQKYNVVIDGTNLKHLFREQIYKVVSDSSAKPILIHLFIDDAIALNRANSRGENFSDLKGILSKCLPETFAAFKSQVELPQKDEFHYNVKSDEMLFIKIDEIMADIIKNQKHE